MKLFIASLIGFALGIVFDRQNVRSVKVSKINELSNENRQAVLNELKKIVEELEKYEKE